MRAFASGSAWGGWSVPAPRRDGWHQSAPATESASCASRPVADRCPRPARRPGRCRAPGDDGVRHVETEALPCPVASVLRRAVFMLDVLAPILSCARSDPGVDARQLVPAAHLETSAAVRPGAGGDVSAKPWLRENGLDAQERLATQGLTPSRAGGSKVIPWLSSAMRLCPAGSAQRSAPPSRWALEAIFVPRAGRVSWRLVVGTWARSAPRLRARGIRRRRRARAARLSAGET